jgi:hypothetical protein
VEAVVTPGPLPGPVPARPSSALERVVALALAAIVVVLVLVLVDLSRAAAANESLPFDFENPLLLAQPGQCVEVVDAAGPEHASLVVVRAPGPVLRPYSGPAKIPGYVSEVWTDARTLPPYLVCDSRPVGSREPGAPPPRSEPTIYPLNGFGMPLEAYCVPRSLRPATVRWHGRTRSGWEVGLMGYVGELEGPWTVWMAKDVPALGTMRREHLTGSGASDVKHFLVPDDCR